MTKNYLKEERREQQAEKALQGDDPLELCRMGWHRASPMVWFRLVAGKTRAFMVYRMGPAPLDYRCTAVFNHGNPGLVCTVCRERIEPVEAPGNG